MTDVKQAALKYLTLFTRVREGEFLNRKSSRWTTRTLTTKPPDRIAGPFLKVASSNPVNAAPFHFLHPLDPARRIQIRPFSPLILQLSTQLFPMSGKGKLGGGKGAKGVTTGSQGGKKQPVSRSAKAGLQFPVGRVHRYLKQNQTTKGRVGGTAAVYAYVVFSFLKS